MADDQEQHYQPEQTGMYELEFPAPQLSAADGRGPVMIHALVPTRMRELFLMENRKFRMTTASYAAFHGAIVVFKQRKQ